jgi:hypothetical protein
VIRNGGWIVRALAGTFDRYCERHALSIAERERLADRLVQQLAERQLAEIANRAARSAALHPAQRRPLDVEGGGA